MERILARVALRSARPRDLTQLRASLALLPALRAALAALDAPLLQELRARIGEHADTLALLHRAIAAEPGAMVRDGDVIAAGYDAGLDELRAIATHTDQFLLDLEKRERERTGIAALKLGYNRVQGFFIELARRDAERAPKDYIRRQTVKSAERFVTAELKGFEDRVLGARDKALARERELYEALLTELIAVLAAAAGQRRSARAVRCAGGPRRTRLRARMEPTGTCRCATPADRSRPSSGGGALQRRPVRTQRPAPGRRAAHAHHHRPEHGREIHLHAPGGAHRASGPHRQLRAGRPARYSARSIASSRASARPTIWPAAARPSWWK